VRTVDHTAKADLHNLAEAIAHPTLVGSPHDDKRA
jgi:hypothetical protein